MQSEMQGLNMYAIKTVYIFLQNCYPFSSDLALIRPPFYYTVRADLPLIRPPFVIRPLHYVVADMRDPVV